MLSTTSDISRRAFIVTGTVASIATIGALSGCAQQAESAPDPEPTPQASQPVPEQDQTADSKVYIVDTFKPKPGDGKSFLNDYLKTYQPMAEGAGMTLVSTTVAPPMWLDSDSNQVQIIWTIDDLAVAAWAMSSATRYNPAYVEWCSQVRKRVVERDRSYYASEEYMEVLNNV